MMMKKPKDIIPTLTGSKLRSYAYAVLTKREYSKVELIEKLCVYALDRNEVIELVEQLAEYNYQSDERVAEMVVRSQIRKGKGPQRIKQTLQQKSINLDYVTDELNQTNWLEEAYKLKIKKFGVEIAKEPKLKAKQIRFLQYRGFDLDIIMKVVNLEELEW